MTLNNIVTLKYGLEVTQSYKMVALVKRTFSYLHSIIAMALSNVISKVK